MYTSHSQTKRFFVLAKTVATKNLFSHSFLSTTVLLVFLTCNVDCEINRTSANVCNKTELQHYTIRESIPKEHEVEDNSSCGILNINCKKTKKIVINMTSIVTQTRNETKYFCCPGYEESSEGECKPKCSTGCNSRGECIKPEVCQCDKPPHDFKPGYAGLACEHFVCLPLNVTDDYEPRWGSDCEKTCVCKSKLDRFCDANDGVCLPMFASSAQPHILELISPSPLVARQAKTSSDLNAEPALNTETSYTLVNFVLVGAILSLLLTLVHYRQRLKKAKIDLFQVAYSARTSSSYGPPDSCRRAAGSIYSTPSYLSSNQSTYFTNSNYRIGHPPLPQIPESSDNSSYNYDSIERQKTTTVNPDIAHRESCSEPSSSLEVLKNNHPKTKVKPIVNAKVEARLIAGQRRTESNIYSDIESFVYRSDSSQYFNDYVESEPTARIEPIYTQQSIISENVPEATKNEDEDESQYQVPRCMQQDLDGVSNIYEEIKLSAAQQSENQKKDCDNEK